MSKRLDRYLKTVDKMGGGTVKADFVRMHSEYTKHVLKLDLVIEKILKSGAKLTHYVDGRPVIEPFAKHPANRKIIRKLNDTLQDNIGE